MALGSMEDTKMKLQAPGFGLALAIAATKVIGGNEPADKQINFKK